jgi:hypothetical protein
VNSIFEGIKGEKGKEKGLREKEEEGRGNAH